MDTIESAVGFANLAAADRQALERAAAFLRANLADHGRPYIRRCPGCRVHYSPSTGELLKRVFAIRISLEMGGWCAGMYRELDFALTPPWETGQEAAQALVDRLIAHMQDSGVKIIEPTVVRPEQSAGMDTAARTAVKKVSKRYWNHAHFARFQKANRANRRIYRRGGPMLG